MTVDRFGADDAEERRLGSNGRERGRPHDKQVISYCEIHLTKRSSSANDMHWQVSKSQKSEDPFDEALAFSERAAPPSPAGPQPRRARLPRPVQTAAGQFGAAGLGPLQAGAPAWLTPGLLRSPLHHQGRRSGSSRGACRSGLLRGRRSRPGQIHAGGPRSEGALGERNIQRMPEAASKGVLGIREPARR